MSLEFLFIYGEKSVRVLFNTPLEIMHLCKSAKSCSKLIWKFVRLKIVGKSSDSFSFLFVSLRIFEMILLIYRNLRIKIKLSSVKRRKIICKVTFNPEIGGKFVKRSVNRNA